MMRAGWKVTRFKLIAVASFVGRVSVEINSPAANTFAAAPCRIARSRDRAPWRSIIPIKGIVENVGGKSVREFSRRREFKQSGLADVENPSATALEKGGKRPRLDPCRHDDHHKKGLPLSPAAGRRRSNRGNETQVTVHAQLSRPQWLAPYGLLPISFQLGFRNTRKCRTRNVVVSGEANRDWHYENTLLR